MKLIVGLGNPGIEYQHTRHNVGFDFLDYIVDYYGYFFNEKKFNGSYCSFIINGEKYLFLKPLSYMNLSGEVVSKFINFYKISLDDILVIHDDLDMSFCRTKVVKNSSSGGHNGIKNIEACIGSKNYTRFKIGISNDKSYDTKNYVLAKFSFDDLDNLRSLFSNVKDLVSDFSSLSLDRLMNKYNKK